MKKMNNNFFSLHLSVRVMNVWICGVLFVLGVFSWWGLFCLVFLNLNLIFFSLLSLFFSWKNHWNERGNALHTPWSWICVRGALVVVVAACSRQSFPYPWFFLVGQTFLPLRNELSREEPWIWESVSRVWLLELPLLLKIHFFGVESARCRNVSYSRVSPKVFLNRMWTESLGFKGILPPAWNLGLDLDWVGRRIPEISTPLHEAQQRL